MNQKGILFWQSKTDFLRQMSSNQMGRILLVVLNYFIWLFLFFISLLLIRKSINIFWQILLSTITAEIIEKIIKSKIYWKRPMFVRHDQTPPGLVDKWYKTGSFPSGHTIKAVYFFLFCFQYGVFGSVNFISVVTPLLLFRVLVGFHYPIDIIGGAVFGSLIWVINSWYTFPPLLNNYLKLIFDAVFKLPYAG